MRNHSCVLFLLAAIVIAPSVWGQTKSPVKKLKPRPTPVLQLENGVVISKVDGLSRPDAQTVCAGDKIAFAAKISGFEEGEKPVVKWTAAAKKNKELVAIENAGVADSEGKYVLDTTGWEPGTYVLTAETMAPYKECEGGCTAYDSKTFIVGDCGSCFTSPSVTLSSPAQVLNPGEIVNVCATPVTGGRNYGTLIPTWTTSAGKISGDVSCAKLDTSGVAPGSTVTVNYKVRAADFEHCEATGTLTLRVAKIDVPLFTELTPCSTFKPNSSRVDNACKAILTDIARQLESDPQAQLVIDSYHRAGEKMIVALERGKNVRDRLADGSIGVKVDANRLIVRPSGVTSESNFVRLYLVPAGAATPAGAPAVSVGDVTKEIRRPSNRRR